MSPEPSDRSKPKRSEDGLKGLVPPEGQPEGPTGFREYYLLKKRCVMLACSQHYTLFSTKGKIHCVFKNRLSKLWKKHPILRVFFHN